MMSDYTSIDWAKLSRGDTNEVMKWAILTSLADEINEKASEEI